MDGKELVFFPKYTTVVDGDIYSDPHEMLEFNLIEVEAHVATFTGTSVTIAIEESNDLETWSTLTSGSGAAKTSLMLSGSDPMRYVRVRLSAFTASGAALTLWVKGVARNA